MRAFLTLHKTYYNQGFWNIPVGFDRYVRSDEGPITLELGEDRREIPAFVNRSANQNGTARIMGGMKLKEWFQQNYAQMDKVPVFFAAPNRIVLGVRKENNLMNQQQRRVEGPMRVKVTKRGITIPKLLLPDVDEVDIRKRNGVIEVTPVR